MKTEILKMLKETPDFLSGQQLCEGLGVSRTAVWKAIRQLEEEGYAIEAVRNRGYRLVASPDVITAPELKTVLSTVWLGSQVNCFYETDSTNRQARKLAEEGAPHGTLVAADSQSAGKGRRGRARASPRGVGVWMSFILRPELSPSKASMLTLVAGMAVVAGIRQISGLSPQIKWPNDAVVDGKKICGILTEMSTEEDSIRYVVVGIGINVNTESFPPEISDTATSLKLSLGHELKRAPLIGAVLKSFEQYYSRFMEYGDMTGLMDEYNEMLANRKRQVRVLDPHGSYEGMALGIDKEGCLLVKREDDSVSAVISGEVSVRGIYGYV